MSTEIAVEWATNLPGKSVEVVCFAAFHVTVNFDDGSLLQIETGYELSRPDGSVEVVNEMPITTSSLFRLAGGTVTHATIDEAVVSIEIGFADGSRLRVVSGANGYESFRVIVGLQEHVF